MKALVTGASGEIGCATAKQLIDDGYTVVAQYNKNFPTELADYAKSKEATLDLIQADLSDEKATEDFCRQVGAINILVNCAGISVVGLVTDISSREARRLMNINLNSAMQITSCLLPEMIRNKFGRIVNISSIWGVYGASCEVHYSASKAALIGFSKALAKEVGLSGITVNAVAPGFVETKMNSHLSDEEKADFLNETMLGRAVTPKEIADVVSFLCSDKASSVTGQTIILGDLA